MANITNVTVTPTETLIDMYNGGLPPPELSAFAFFVIFGAIVSIWFAYMIFASENA